MRPRLSPWATVPRIPNGAPSARAASSTCAGRHQAADVRRGHDLAVELDQLDDARLERVLGGQQRRVAARACCRSGSSRRPTRARASRRATSTWSMNSCAVCGGERAVERDHDQLLDAERGDQVRLLLERREQLRRRPPARRPCAGAARRSARLSASRITSRWPMCTPSNSPTARRRGSVVASGSQTMSISRGSLRRA